MGQGFEDRVGGAKVLGKNEKSHVGGGGCREELLGTDMEEKEGVREVQKERVGGLQRKLSLE